MSDFDTIKVMVKFFFRQQMRYPALFWGMIVSHVFANLFLRFLPALIIASILNKLSTHAFTKGHILSDFGPSVAWAIALNALGGIIIWRIVIFCNWKLEGYIQRDINRIVFDHLMKLSATFHANRFSGSLVSQTSKLAGAYVRFTDTTVFQTLGLFWALVFTAVILMGRAPLFVAILIGFTAIYMFVAIALTGRIRKLNVAQAEAENTQTGQLADSITNVMAVKGFAAAKPEIKRFGVTTEKTRRATHNLMSATLKRDMLFGSIGTLINAVAIVVSIISIVEFNANIATVFLILNYTSDILQRLWEFSTQALRDYNRAIGDAQSMLEVLAIQPSVKDPVQPEKLRTKDGKIDFKDVIFAHDGAEEEPLFNKLNLSINASEKIGLVGHSGSGKTTFTKLLLRFNDIDEGEILIDGQNIAHITQDDLRSQIAYVPQEPLLFHRSIRENIAYGKQHASEEDIRAAAEKAHALEFIDKLPKGFDTLVGERGVKLSGGQRQRIAIARAILKDAPILVLDEATSALDSESEKLIQDALWELMKGRTAIVIAHRLSTIQKMDRILVMEDGSIAEQGSHAELVKSGGTYAELWAHQSGGFIEE